MLHWRNESEGKGLMFTNILLSLTYDDYNILRSSLHTFYADAHLEEVIEDFFYEGRNSLATLIEKTPDRIIFHFEDMAWISDLDLLDDDDYDNPYIFFMIELEGFYREHSAVVFNKS